MNKKATEKMKSDLENFGQSLYNHAAKSRQARAAIASVDYLDQMGVLEPLGVSGAVKAIKPTAN